MANNFGSIQKFRESRSHGGIIADDIMIGGWTEVTGGSILIPRFYIKRGGTRATFNEYRRSSIVGHLLILRFDDSNGFRVSGSTLEYAGGGDRIINHTSDRLTIHFSHMLIAVY